MQQVRNDNQQLLEERARAERNKAFQQLGKRRRRQLSPTTDDDSADEASNDGDDGGHKQHRHVALLEHELDSVRDQLKESEEELQEAVERADEVALENERLQLRCRELEFQAQTVLLRSSLGTVVGAGAATGTVASGVGVRQARFSTFSANPSVKQGAVAAIPPSLAPVPLQFFGPPTATTINAAMATQSKPTPRNRFKIVVNDNSIVTSDDESDFSFVQCEAECRQLAELQQHNDLLVARETGTSRQLGALQQQLGAASVGGVEQQLRSLGLPVAPGSLHQQIEEHRRLVALCNEYLVERPRSRFGLQMSHIGCDTKIDDIADHFRRFWDCLREKLANQVSTIGDRV